MPCAAAAASAFLHIATGEDGFKKKKIFYGIARSQ